jgi:hypothetical protein
MQKREYDGWIDYDSPNQRVPAEYRTEHRRLIYICGGDPLGGLARPFMQRAHQLLAKELNAYFVTTDRNHHGGNIDVWYLGAGAPGPGGTDVARFFGRASTLPFNFEGSTPQVPGPSEGWYAALGQMRADLAQLELDIAAAGGWP